MKLIVTVAQAPQGSREMEGRQFEFEGRGFSFGRAATSDLELPDPQKYVSSQHGRVELNAGVYSVVDTSSNGLFVNDQNEALGRGGRFSLQGDTRLRAGEFELLLQLQPAQAEMGEPLHQEPEDQLVADLPLQAGSEHAQELAEQLALRLGLHGLSESHLDRMPEEVTSLLRKCIASVMDVLSERRNVKTQLNMETTVIQTTHNNALKVSLSAEEAIERMFTKSGDAYMAPEEALIEAFQDIADHQVAMMAATLRVYKQVVERFEPHAVEERLDQHAGKKGLFSGKRRTWDEYKEQYIDIASDGAGTIHEAFLQEFAAAYADQLLRITQDRGAGAA